jgi:cytochrome d ubiquinol oxidase subunit I
MLAYNQLYGQVQGINNLQAEYQERYGPGDYIPPVAVVYWTFRIMVGAGFLMLVLAAYALFLVMGEAFDQRQVALTAFVWAIGLPYLANSAGWIMTEIGRAPWAVFGLMKIENAVSPTVSIGMLAASLLGFTLVYGLLMAADVFLLAKFARAGGLSAEERPPVHPSEGELALIGVQD